MPTTITVLSWNVESLGDGKATQPLMVPPQQSEVINFISLGIQLARADLVGIMEVKSGRGGLILAWLLASLNNARPPAAAYAWDGRVSSRQDGGTQEEALLLWKEEAGRLQLDAAAEPGPTWSIGVVDNRVLEGLLVAKGWVAAPQQQQFFGALAASGYVRQGAFRDRNANRTTTTLRMVPDRWNALNTAGAAATVAFAAPPAQQPPAAMAATELRALASKLVGVDILRFVSYGDRSPYIGNFLVGNPAKRLTVSLLHAPGPQDVSRMSAINNIALSPPLVARVAQDSLLVMGDFNIDDNRTNSLLARAYERTTNAQGAFGFYQRTPVQTSPVFTPVAGAPLNAPDQLHNRQTSLVNTYLPDNAAAAQTLGNTFDKFFFHGSTTAGHQITGANPRVLDAVQVTASNQGVAYNAGLGQSALTFYRAFRGAAFLATQLPGLQRKHAKAVKTVAQLTNRRNNVNAAIANAGGHLPPKHPLVRRKQTVTNELTLATASRDSLADQVAAIGLLQTIVATPATLAPTGIGSALSVYRYAVSDHLPIAIDLTAT